MTDLAADAAPPPRTLVVVRHAKAVEPTGANDFARPLAERGRIEARLAGALLSDVLAGTVTALVSPALRTRQTWELIANGEIAAEFDSRLYGADVVTMIDVIREVPIGAPSVLLVGHNPGCAELVSFLTGAPISSFPTSAVARLGIDEPWSEIAEARLISLEVPRSQPR